MNNFDAIVAAYEDYVSFVCSSASCAPSSIILAQIRLYKELEIVFTADQEEAMSDFVQLLNARYSSLQYVIRRANCQEYLAFETLSQCATTHFLSLRA